MVTRTFRVLVLANSIDWQSLPQKMDAVRAFYAPVCNLDIQIRGVSLNPVYALYPELAPLYVVDRGWYDFNLATPNALAADIILFITKAPATTPTYAGYMSYNNVGPWETTVFVHGGENDHTYLSGKDMGDAFTLIACHELSHAFYRMVGKPDATHAHFPTIDPSGICDNDPSAVLADFDFQARPAILNWLLAQLAAIATALSLLKKQHMETMVDSPAPSGTIISADSMNQTYQPKILQWSKAIALEEGARPDLNNPGNLKYSTLTASWGATKGFQATDGGWIAKFPTLKAGQTALCNFLLLGCENELLAFHAPAARTLEGFTKIYAGNPPQGYIDGIVRDMGVPGDTQISTFLG